MKTLFLEKPNVFQIRQQTKPTDLAPHEALLKIKKIGICGTDYHAFRGKQPFFSYPRVLGHELGAEVVALGAPTDRVLVGDKVTVEPYLNCESCQSCLNGKGNCCENLQVLGVHMDGGMTEYLKVPMRKLHVSKKLSFEQLAIVEPLSIGAHAVQRAEVSAKDLVLVIGAGPIGLAVMQFAKISGATVVVLDINKDRLNFAKQHLKVDFTLEATNDFESKISDFRKLGSSEIQNSTSEILRGCLNGFLPTVVFDATGNPDSMQNAFNYTSFGGKLVYVGLFIGEASFDDPLFHRREITLLASRNSLPQDFSNIIQLMEMGKIDTTAWVTHRTDFDDLPNVFNDWLDPKTGVIKAVVSI